MSQMLPESGEVMRRAACGDVCAAPAPRAPRPATSSENKELLRQQLLSASKERNVEKSEPPKAKHTRSRQKNRWKLKFHHQALPQEYLDHYEQSLQRASKKRSPEKPKDQNVENNFTNETFKIWAQRLAGVQKETAPATAPRAPVSSVAARNKEERRRRAPAIAPSKIVTYEDLPYMGEMTLNDSKPRRGRKPKKADICHLIYENYGTVVPGQPPPRDGTRSPAGAAPADAAPGAPRTDLQNKIISSLLERKFSQQRRRWEPRAPPHAPPPAAPRTAAGPLHSDREPLNLCIRDLRDLKLQIQRKFGNIYPSAPEAEAEDAAERGGSPGEQPNAISVIQRNTNVPPTAGGSPERSRPSPPVSPAPSEPARPVAGPDDDKFPGYVYWPAAGVYMHPLALQTQLLCYQRLAAAGGLAAGGLTAGGLGAGGLALSPEDRDGVSTPGSESASTDTSPEESKSKLVLKQITELLDPKVIKRVEGGKSPEPAKKRTSPNPVQGPVKRKRSAIFIPPMPAKNGSSTPTTEVSICKFKFTGGSKPSLQEKKMLSVDSGGNFRYYSGTGNKGNKGYEYLQKDSNRERSPEAAAPTPTLPKPDAQSSATLKDDLNKKKRKSRKTLQREKLEQTFKEKGFLIQTQQLQSAEGATYCKFRQLRKFTRYLFRSWKDYLPGELDDRPAPAGEPTAGEWT